MAFRRWRPLGQLRIGNWCRGLLAVLAMLPSIGCSSESSGHSSPAAAAVPVVVATAEQRDVPLEIHAIGTVEPFSTVTVRAQVEGQLAGVHFREGEEVRKGDLLFTVDPRPFEAALRQAQANLARNQAEATNAEVEEKRLQRLVSQQLISNSEYDQAVAKAASLRAAVVADQAAVERSKLQLQYCHIHAPIEGRVGRLLVNEGNVVKANDNSLAVINQVRPVFVAFAVPQQELSEIRTRAAAGTLPVRVVAGDKDVTVGELTFINNTVDVSSGTVLLKAKLPNDTEVLWPGEFVDVAVTLATQHDAVVIPATAVQVGQQGQYVFVVGPDLTAEVRTVVTAKGLGGADVVVTSGLTPGERVVVDGQLRLAPGMKVEVKDATGTADGTEGSIRGRAG